MKRLRLLPGGAAVALATSLVACGGSPQAAVNPSIESVVVAVGALPDSLTPSPWGGSASHVVLTGLGSQLLEYKAGASDGKTCPTPSTELSGRLAESAKPSADGTGVVVTLRKLTSQFGNTLSAEDIRWSFDIGMKRQPVMKGTLKSSGFNVDNLVKVIDEHTVQLNTKALTSYTEESLQNNLFYVHDSTEAKKHVTAEDPTANAWLSKNLADYSGWKLEEFTPGASLTVTADPKWEGTRGTVKRVAVKAVQSTATRSQLVESGEVQVANGFEYDQYKSLEKAPGVTVLDCASQTRDTMMINTKTGPLADPKVRHAVSLAIDREALIKGAYAGFGQPAGSIFPMVEDSAIYKFNKDEAKKLLAEAGYANGFPMTLSYSATRPGPVAAKSAVLLQSMLKDVGIDVQLQNVASSTDFSTALLEGRYQAVLYSEPIVIADPAFYSYAFYGTGAPSNSTGWSSPEFDKARSELAATPDTEADKRTTLLKKMASLVDDGAAILSLVETRGVLVTKTGLSGAVPLANGQIYFSALGR
ncbi:ABC transporter substrate-binding protein [Arthrobacter sp. NPDC058130]|uniref:ABC transporter substrate-binding protein n=1 Tax=Arthrobacter sp. NPDC058130 TaxID=3346353 RepID=UPI0036E54A6B